MTQPTFEDAMTALRAADAAGNVEDARRLAKVANSLKGASPDTSGGLQYPILANLNRGIADSIGGVIDFVNPFDQPHALNPFPEGTGSARRGLTNAMRAVGVEVAEGDPQTNAQAFARGSGQALGSVGPAGATLKAGAKAGGAVGQFADDAYSALASRSGVAAEMTAGGASSVARREAAEAGAPPWAQEVAAIAGGLSPAAVVAAPRYAPTGAAGRAFKRNLAPYTEAGGQEIARTRMQALAGGEDRAAEVARRVSDDNELGLTPAQQTADPNMMGVERLASEQNPALRARLDERALSSQEAGRSGVRGLGGDPDDMQAFFKARRDEFSTDLSRRAREAVDAADAKIAAQSGTRSESENSRLVGEQIDIAYETAKREEAALWDAVPRSEIVPTTQTKAAVERFSNELPYAQRDDLPERAREVLSKAEVYGATASVNNMHGLYSKLRETARAAMAGNNQQKNLARVSNEIADAILDDLGASTATGRIGVAINEARAYSAAMHETFDRGAVGRLQKRTLDGDMSIDPELSLKRTVGRSGVEGAVGARQIEEATRGGASPFIQDYIRDRFKNAAMSPTGEFTNASAQRFLLENDELIRRYPDLRADIDGAVAARENAEQFSRRIASRLKALAGKGSIGRAAVDGQAVQAVFSARSPAQAARRLANEARKDTSGAAMAGLKGAFADELIARASGVKSGTATFSGDALLKATSNRKTLAVIQQVFDGDEIFRLRKIGAELEKVSGRAADIGESLSAAKPSKIIEFVARIAAARHGAELGGSSGGSLQTAQMASSRVRDYLSSLTSDKASEIMARAVEDPQLFKALLTNARAIKPGELDRKVMPRLVPYLIGTVSAGE